MFAAFGRDPEVVVGGKPIVSEAQHLMQKTSSNDSMSCRKDCGVDLECAGRAKRRRALIFRNFIMTVEQTLAELVAIDSVSAGSNAGIISYIEKRCEEMV